MYVSSEIGSFNTVTRVVWFDIYIHTSADNEHVRRE